MVIVGRIAVARLAKRILVNCHKTNDLWPSSRSPPQAPRPRGADHGPFFFSALGGQTRITQSSGPVTDRLHRTDRASTRGPQPGRAPAPARRAKYPRGPSGLHAIARHRSYPENLRDFRMMILNRQLSVDGK